jgi:hypothetical protein
MNNRDGFVNQEEYHVTTQFEQPAARKLGEGVRLIQNGRFFKTSGVTSTLTKREYRKSIK